MRAYPIKENGYFTEVNRGNFFFFVIFLAFPLRRTPARPCPRPAPPHTPARYTRYVYAVYVLDHL